MDRAQLLSELVAANPQPGDLVYVERSGTSYHWELSGKDATGVRDPSAEAWIYYSWQRQLGDPKSAGAMLDDLLAEMESMIGSGADRCRWPLDEPWPQGH